MQQSLSSQMCVTYGLLVLMYGGFLLYLPRSPHMVEDVSRRGRHCRYSGLVALSNGPKSHIASTTAILHEATGDSTRRISGRNNPGGDEGIPIYSVHSPSPFDKKPAATGTTE